MDVLCEIVEIKDDIVVFEFEDEHGKSHRRMMTQEIVKLVKNLNLLYEHALFIVESAGDSVIIKACEGEIDLAKELWSCS